jgi:hypothetical protein
MQLPSYIYHIMNHEGKNPEAGRKAISWELKINESQEII